MSLFGDTLECMARRKRRSHLVIPDLQIEPGVPLKHLTAIGRLAAELQPWAVILLGDVWDFRSLCSYEDGKIASEGTRIQDDIDAGNRGLDLLMHAMRRTRWKPRLHLCLGNHEHRLERHVEANPKLQGLITYDLLNAASHGFTVHPYLEAFELSGILYSHFFPRSATGHVAQSNRGAPSAMQQVRREMQSCTAGHRQGLDYYQHITAKRIYHGLQAGSCYLHKTVYMPQGEAYWRGVVLKENVERGDYDFRPIRLSSLVR